MTRVTADREAEDAEGTFGGRIAALRPEAVIDLICFTAASARQLRRGAAPVAPAAGALRDHLGARPRAAGAGDRGRAPHRLRRVRHGQGRDRGTAAPGDPGGRRPGRGAAPRSHQRAGLAGHHPGREPRPRRVDCPGDGPAARAARPRARRPAPRARRRRGAGVRARAVPARGDRRQLPRGGRAGDDAAGPGGRRGARGSAASRSWTSSSWDEFARRAGPGHAEVTREHTSRSITASIARAREVLGYAPRYSALDALHEALAWLVANGQADVGGQPLPARQRRPGGR